MNAAQTLRDLGQSLRLDAITRALLDNDTLARGVDQFAPARQRNEAAAR